MDVLFALRLDIFGSEKMKTNLWNNLVTNFAPWGGSFNIKGLVTIGPFMDVTAQIDAIATISG